MFYNPNYATIEEYARIGIYAWCGRYHVMETIRLQMRMLNVNPSMRSAKSTLGYRPLKLCAIIGACWSCARRQPRQGGFETAIGEHEDGHCPAHVQRSRRDVCNEAEIATSTTPSPGDLEGACEIPPETYEEHPASGHVAIAIHAQSNLVKQKNSGISHPAPKGGKRAAMKRAALAKLAAEADAKDAANMAAAERQHVSQTCKTQQVTCPDGKICNSEHIDTSEIEAWSLASTASGSSSS